MSEKLSERINGLPNWARDYIHDLETRCDITGDIRMIHIQKETIAYLEQRLAAKDAEIAKLCERMKRDADSWDEKNEGAGSPKGCSVDYIYGYNAGCAETFRACAYRLEAALAETSAAPEVK